MKREKRGAWGRGSRARYRRAVVEFIEDAEAEVENHEFDVERFGPECECIPVVEDEHRREAARWRKHLARARRILATLDAAAGKVGSGGMSDEPTALELEVEDMLHACGWENLIPGQRGKCREVARFILAREARLRLSLATLAAATACLLDAPTPDEVARVRALLVELGEEAGDG